MCILQIGYLQTGFRPASVSLPHQWLYLRIIERTIFSTVKSKKKNPKLAADG